MKAVVLLTSCLYLTSYGLGKVLVDTDSTFDIRDDESEIEKGSPPQERINLSVPGTKWCGPGYTADDYDDLGAKHEEDRCCRAHDHCDGIVSRESKYNLTNDDYFTRLHCRCDKEFRDCLKAVNTTFAKRLGTFYFDVRDRCYKQQHPVMECAEEKHRLFLRRCTKYIVDKSKPPIYQWFDLPFFDDDTNFAEDDEDNHI